MTPNGRASSAETRPFAFRVHFLSPGQLPGIPALRGATASRPPPSCKPAITRRKKSCKTGDPPAAAARSRDHPAQELRCTAPCRRACSATARSRAARPNGRRFGDDVVNIAVSALVGDLRDPAHLVINPADGIDDVSPNDQGYSKVFPYAGTPLNGRNRCGRRRSRGRRRELARRPSRSHGRA